MSRATAVADEKSMSPSKAREYAVIRFPGKTKKTDPDIVSIGVNGIKIRCKRNELIPIQAPFIEALRNAKEPVVEGGEGFDPTNSILRRRKIVNFAARFPFELIGWIDEETYEDFRRRTTEGESLTEKEVFARIG